MYFIVGNTEQSKTTVEFL